ncbi:E3 ubiquitin-protein ligase dtx3l [Mortierella sp. GBA30]|nr:E3 ubiquitin-protein ligase dtx3l [Mortierella sp. GBA30]
MPLIRTFRAEFSGHFTQFFEDCPPELERAASIPFDGTPPLTTVFGAQSGDKPRVTDQPGPIKLLNLDPNIYSDLCRTIAGDFYSHTRDRSDYTIQSVHVLRNPIIWKRYQAEKRLRRQLAEEERTARERMRARAPEGNPSAPTFELSIAGLEASPSAADEEDPEELFRDEIMFHGTHKKRIPSILLNGLDPRTTTRASHGKGVYFSDSIEKCMGYIDIQTSMDQEYSIIMCCVLLGKVLVEPYSAKTLTSQSMFLPAGYDSAVAQDFFKEWIIFEKSQILPLCVINFKTTNRPDSFFRLCTPNILLNGATVYPSSFHDIQSLCIVPTPTDNSQPDGPNDEDWRDPDVEKSQMLLNIFNIPIGTAQICNTGITPWTKVWFVKAVISPGAPAFACFTNSEIETLVTASNNIQLLQDRLDQDVTRSKAHQDSQTAVIERETSKIPNGGRLIELMTDIGPDLERLQDAGKKANEALEQLKVQALGTGRPGILQSHEFLLAVHPYQSLLSELKVNYDLKAAPLGYWNTEQILSAEMIVKTRKSLEFTLRLDTESHDRQTAAIQAEKERVHRQSCFMFTALTEAEIDSRRALAKAQRQSSKLHSTFAMKDTELLTSTIPIWPHIVAELLMPWLIIRQLPHSTIELLNDTTTINQKGRIHKMGLRSDGAKEWWDIAPQVTFQQPLPSYLFWPVDPRRRLPNRRLFTFKDYIEWMFLERESRTRTRELHRRQPKSLQSQPAQEPAQDPLAGLDIDQYLQEQWDLLDPCILQSIQGLFSRWGTVIFNRKERQAELDSMGSDLLNGLFESAEPHMLIRNESLTSSTSQPGSSKPPPAECPICQEDLELPEPGTNISAPEPEKVVKLKSCRHCFHEECIKQWFQSSASQLKCPMCSAMCSTGAKAGATKNAIKLGPMPDAIMGYNFEVRLCCYLLYIVVPEHTVTGDDGVKRVIKTDLRYAIVPFSARLGPLLMIRLICLFYYGYLFRVGRSLTRNVDNVVVWNGVHMRTSMHGSHGFPAPNYERNCWDEINQKGIALGLDELVLNMPQLESTPAPQGVRLGDIALPPEIVEELAAQDMLNRLFHKDQPLLFK